MEPTPPVSPHQQIERTYRSGELAEEIVHNYPPDGGGTRRWVDAQGQEQSTAVTGLAISVPPTPAADLRLAALSVALGRMEAPVLSADVVAAIREALA